MNVLDEMASGRGSSPATLDTDYLFRWLRSKKWSASRGCHETQRWDWRRSVGSQERVRQLNDCFSRLIQPWPRFTLTPPNSEYARISSGRNAPSSSPARSADSDPLEGVCCQRGSMLRPPNRLKPSNIT